MRPTIVVSGQTMRRTWIPRLGKRLPCASSARVTAFVRQTFYDEVKRGRIKTVKLGKKTMIMRSEAEAWAASLPALELASTASNHFPTEQP